MLVDTAVPLACLQPQHIEGNGAGSKGISSSEDNSREEQQESLQGTDTDSLVPVRNQTVQQKEALALIWMVIGPFLGDVWVWVCLCTNHLFYWNTDFGL